MMVTQLAYRVAGALRCMIALLRLSCAFFPLLSVMATPEIREATAHNRNDPRFLPSDHRAFFVVA